MEVYLDNAATTRPFDSVIEIMLKTLRDDYGNPSSLHTKGFEAEKYIKQAANIIAKNLKVEDKEIYFTSGGTEANNLAIIGSAIANKRTGNHIITTSIEHASVYSTFNYLEELGFEVTFLPVDNMGIISLEELEKAIRDETILVSIMHVNNEIGSVQPIDKISEIIKGKNSKTLFHVDAIQGFGKYYIYPKRQNIDLLSISAHKIHGPKGVGAVYIKDRVKVKPLIYGGGHQKGLRSGTENVPGIAGFGEAAKKIYEGHEDKIQRLYKLKESFIVGVSQIDDIIINGMDYRDGAPHIISVSFKNVRSEVLLHALEEKGIYISSGSACSSNKPGISNTLVAIGVAKEYLDSTVRFSFSVTTTEEEINYCIETLKSIIPFLRKYVRGGK